MRAVTAQIARYPGVLVLLVAIVVGQVLQRLVQPHLTDATLVAELPLVATVALVAQVVLALVILWFRVRLGNQLLAGARQRALKLPDAASLPKEYAIADPAAQITSGGLGVVDLILLLLVQSTLRGPVLSLTDHFLIRRTTAESVFVGVVVLIAVLMLLKLWRAGGPVLVLLLWWGLDRVVPTAGFLGARAEVATAKTLTGRGLTPAALPSAHSPSAPEATVAAASAQEEETVLAPATQEASDAFTARDEAAPRKVEEDATVMADATVVTRKPSENDEATVMRPEKAS